MPKTVLITGAANGLGAAFVQAYRTQDVHIIALDRQKSSISADNIESHTVDVQDEASIEQFAQLMAGRAVDLVIHSAGIRGLVPAIENQQTDDVEACESLQVMDSATLLQTFQINAVGTFLLLRALLPSLELARQPKVIVMSSRMGSVGNNEAGKRAAGGAYAYRASKAALNTMIRSMAVDTPGVTYVLCHPGRVETKLVKWKESGAISADESVQDMLPLIERWQQKDSGKYYDRFGETIEW